MRGWRLFLSGHFIWCKPKNFSWKFWWFLLYILSQVKILARKEIGKKVLPIQICAIFENFHSRFIRVFFAPVGRVHQDNAWVCLRFRPGTRLPERQHHYECTSVLSWESHHREVTLHLIAAEFALNYKFSAGGASPRWPFPTLQSPHFTRSSGLHLLEPCPFSCCTLCRVRFMILVC